MTEAEWLSRPVPRLSCTPTTASAAGRMLAQVLAARRRRASPSACASLRPDGEVRWVETQSTRRPGQRPHLLVAHDVTDREEAFMDRLAGAFRDAPLGMALVAPGGAFLRVNSTLCRLLGHTEEELLAEALPDVVEDARVGRGAARRRRAVAADSRRRMRHRDGRPVVALVSAHARARLARRAAVLRLPGPRHDRAQRGAGAPGRQRGQARRGPADRAHGLVGVGDRGRPRHLVRRALPHPRRAPDDAQSSYGSVPRQGPPRRPRPRRARHRDGAHRAPAVEPRLPHRAPRRRRCA